MSVSPEKNYEIGLLLDLYGALLSNRQREVCDLYYNDDLSLAEVAEECGITRQGVRDALLKAEEQLKLFEARLGLLHKQQMCDQLKREIENDLQALESKGADVSALQEKIRALPY